MIKITCFRVILLVLGSIFTLCQAFQPQDPPAPGCVPLCINADTIEPGQRVYCMSYNAQTISDYGQVYARGYSDNYTYMAMTYTCTPSCSQDWSNTQYAVELEQICNVSPNDVLGCSIIVENRNQQDGYTGYGVDVYYCPSSSTSTSSGDDGMDKDGEGEDINIDLEKDTVIGIAVGSLVGCLLIGVLLGVLVTFFKLGKHKRAGYTEINR